jgi:hypothetical protein
MNPDQLRDRVQTLTQAMRQFANTLGALCEDLTTDPTPPVDLTTTLPKAARPCPQADWPRIGGKEELPSTADILASRAFRDAFRSRSEREIYLGASTGLAGLAALLRLPLYKISTVSPGRLNERIYELRNDKYGAEHHDDGRYVLDPDGFNDWFASHNYLTRRANPNSPVDIHPRALTVHLPVGMTDAMFDAAFDFEIRKAAVDRFVATPEGIAHCQALGVNPAVAMRGTAYPLGASARHSPCAEIAVLRVREDSDRLVTIAERVVLKHLGLIA